MSNEYNQSMSDGRCVVTDIPDNHIVATVHSSINHTQRREAWKGLDIGNYWDEEVLVGWAEDAVVKQVQERCTFWGQLSSSNKSIANVTFRSAVVIDFDTKWHDATRTRPAHLRHHPYSDSLAVTESLPWHALLHTSRSFGAPYTYTDGNGRLQRITKENNRILIPFLRPVPAEDATIFFTHIIPDILDGLGIADHVDMSGFTLSQCFFPALNNDPQYHARFQYHFHVGERFIDMEDFRENIESVRSMPRAVHVDLQLPNRASLRAHASSSEFSDEVEFDEDNDAEDVYDSDRAVSVRGVRTSFANQILTRTDTLLDASRIPFVIGDFHGDKEPCFCPQCDPTGDNTHRSNFGQANAFLSYSKKHHRYYVYCSSCHATYWERDIRAYLFAGAAEFHDALVRDAEGDARLFTSVSGTDAIYDIKRETWFHSKPDKTWFELPKGTQLNGTVSQTLVQQYSVYKDSLHMMLADYDFAKPKTRPYDLRRAINAEIEAVNQRIESLNKGSRGNTVLSLLVDPIHLGRTGIEWDAKRPYFLPAQNGWVNLSTMVLEPYQYDNFITDPIPTPFDPNASTTALTDFYTEVLGGAQEAESFQITMGYGICSDPIQNIFLICQGHAQNGKDTGFKIFENAFGSKYCASLGKASIQVASSKGERPQPDLTRLRFAYVAYTSEIEDGDYLSSAAVKQISGGTTLNHRDLHKSVEPFTFKGVFSIITNPPPKFDAGEALFTRVLYYNFPVQYHRKDESIDVSAFHKYADHEKISRLKADTAGTLAWFVEGAHKYIQNGKVLMQTDSMKSHARKYTEEIDTFQDFAKRFLEYDQHKTREQRGTKQVAKHRLSLPDLRKLYNQYRESDNRKPVAQSRVEAGLARYMNYLKLNAPSYVETKGVKYAEFWSINKENICAIAEFADSALLAKCLGSDPNKLISLMKSSVIIQDESDY